MYEVYEVRLHRAVDKAIAKLDRPVRARIKEEILRLRNNPLLGYPLTGKHAGRRSLHLRAAGVEYREVAGLPFGILASGRRERDGTGQADVSRGDDGQGAVGAMSVLGARTDKGPCGSYAPLRAISRSLTACGIMARNGRPFAPMTLARLVAPVALTSAGGEGGRARI